MRSSPRVWILTYMDPSRGSGVERFVSNLSSALKEDGFDVNVIDATSQTGEGSVIRKARPLMAWRLGRVVNKRAGPDDIVVSNGYFSWNAKVGKAMVVFHGTELGRALATRAISGKLRNLAVRKINARLDRKSGRGRTIVAVSESTKLEIEQLYGLKVNAVIPNGIDLDQFRPAGDRAGLRSALGLPLDKTLILYAGPPDRRKGFDFLLNDVAPALKPSQRLVMTVDVGERPAGVIPVGRIGFDDIVKYYQACDCFVMPSYYEGCSYALAEALSCGLPSIVSKTGSATELLADEILSRYVMPAMDAREYAKAFTALESAAEAKRASIASRRFAESHFDVKVFNNRYSELIKGLAGR